MRAEVKIGKFIVPYEHFPGKTYQGQPVLFLGGYNGPREAYLPLFDKLGFETVFPIINGRTSFFSAHPQEFGDVVETTKEFCEELGIEPKLVIAHSYGCLVSWCMSQGYDFDKMVAISAPYTLDYEAGDYARGLLNMSIHDSLTSVDGAIFVAKKMPGYLLNFLRAPATTEHLLQEVSKFLCNGFHVDAPSLIIHGEGDHVSTLDELVAALIEQKFDDATIRVLDNYRHMGIMTQPQRTADEIRQFIGDSLGDSLGVSFGDSLGGSYGDFLEDSSVK